MNIESYYIISIIMYLTLAEKDKTFIMYIIQGYSFVSSLTYIVSKKL